MTPQMQVPGGSVPGTAVLLLAYGGPDALADVPAYLAHIRSGREMPQRLIDEFIGRYRQIGGCSPLLQITRSTAAQLQAAIGLPVYVGMRHWRPFIHDVVAQMAADGVQHIVAICMAPHYSRLSIGAYRAALDAALAATGAAIRVEFFESWHTQPDYVAGVADRVRDALARFQPDVRARVTVVFTAHSLPASGPTLADPYEAQLSETARQVADRLALPADRWLLAYQSAPRTDAPWLGPQVEGAVVALAGRGEKQLVIAPIGFVADHVETLYDLDIRLWEFAQSHGVRAVRAAVLNDSPALVAALADLVRQAIAGHGQGAVSLAALPSSSNGGPRQLARAK